MSVPVDASPLVDNLRTAVVNLLNALPSPEGCGCAERKRRMIEKIEGAGNART